MPAGNGSTSLGVLAEIDELLAAIAPEQFVAPKEGGNKDVDNVVTSANDDIKRLFTLRDRLASECNDLSTRVQELMANAMAYVYSNGRRKTIEDVGKPNSPMFQAIDRIDDIYAELRRLNDLCDVVDKVLWLEIRRQHPDLTRASVVGILSDWSLVWRKTMATDSAEALIHRR